MPSVRRRRRRPLSYPPSVRRPSRRRRRRNPLSVRPVRPSVVVVLCPVLRPSVVHPLSVPSSCSSVRPSRPPAFVVNYAYMGREY